MTNHEQRILEAATSYKESLKKTAGDVARARDAYLSAALDCGEIKCPTDFVGLIESGLKDEDAQFILEGPQPIEKAMRVISDLCYSSKKVTDAGGLAKHYLATIRRLSELFASPREEKSEKHA